MVEKGEVLVEVKNVSKKFSRNLKRSLWYGLLDMGKALMGRTSNNGRLRKDEFWAVKDINFTLRRGECLGLIGHNGAGKSTLLKMLNGLIRPDEGTILMRGKIGALIELGAGFNPLLSGRENIYINGQLLGFTKKEIDAKLTKILEFSEIGDFIDTPVQNYSSGMKVRLGFAVAIQMEPDVLIVDEVLAVGDTSFRGKCLQKISEIINKAAVIFVSHSMGQVVRVCNRGILLNHGKLSCDDEIPKVVDQYYDSFKAEEGNSFLNKGNRLEYIKCNGLVLNKSLEAEISFDSFPEFEVKCFIEDERFPRFKIHFLNRDLHIVASSDSLKNKVQINQNGEVLAKFRVGPILLRPGQYKISLGVLKGESNIPLLFFEAWWKVKITGIENDHQPSYIILKQEFIDN